jgi:exodeoxyribonuclease-5
MVEWSNQQLEALADIEAWYWDSDRQCYLLVGYAGTGKTTLAREAAHRLKVSTAFATYTGKAAFVMRQKGCADADTIDALIYKPHIQYSCLRDPRCNDPPCNQARCRYLREKFVGREINEDSTIADARLVIIDEVSMVNALMGKDLLSFNRKVLTLGDNFQLPPIEGAGFFTNRAADFELTEVRRQAFDSPIIRLATRVRMGKPLKVGRYGDSRVVTEISSDRMLEHEQIIVGTHVTRCDLNGKIRREYGFRGDAPEPGEKLLCLKNDRRLGLRNGTLWKVLTVRSDAKGFLDMTVVDDDGNVVDVVAPIDTFSATDGSGGDLPGNPFTFGYVITAHKAQGSQWDSVCVVNEGEWFREHRFRWLYTALTRAAQKVTVVV